jgi:transposase
MRVRERIKGDVRELERMIAAEGRARARDRLRMVLLALRGMEKEGIARTLGAAKSTVETWVYRYRDGGLDALKPARRKGRAPRLGPEQAAAFRERFIAGPAQGDGVCTLRGKDAVRILSDEFKVGYSLSGAYQLLHRLGLSCLVPRPRHEKNNPESTAAFKESAPLLSGASSASAPAGGSWSTPWTKGGSGSKER